MIMLSCKSFLYGVEPNFTMGMSETEFKEKNKSDVELVLATENGNKVFRTHTQTLYYGFFFFKDEKLVRYEKGLEP